MHKLLEKSNILRQIRDIMHTSKYLQSFSTKDWKNWQWLTIISYNLKKF